MKALSIQQPWAWLIVNGHKDVENRDWPTNIRGRIAIHAGKKFDQSAVAWVQRNFPDIALPSEYPMGGIVGYATIERCVPHSPSPWFQGAYGFLLREAEPCALVPFRGQLGFFPGPPTENDAHG